MRIVVMTDSHANLPALQAALKDIRGNGYDVIVHTGDAVAIGPYPAECLDLLFNTRDLRERRVPERDFIQQFFFGRGARDVVYGSR
jgi:predicted phosphodiesterase